MTTRAVRFLRRGLPSALLELAIVAVGVLIALAADDWWTDRVERREERELLTALDDDLAATVDLSVRNIRNALKVVAGGSSGPAGKADGAAPRSRARRLSRSR